MENNRIERFSMRRWPFIFLVMVLTAVTATVQPYTHRNDTTQMIWQLRQIERFVRRAQPTQVIRQHEYAVVAG